MSSNIEIKFLTPKEMENAGKIDYRYEHVKSDNLGFADKLKNRVYVRAGLDPELTKYLINHEVSHLFEIEGTDEDENGIRHKGNFWKEQAWNEPVGQGANPPPEARGNNGVLPAIIGMIGTAIGQSWLGPLLSGSMGAAGKAIGQGLGAFGGSATGNALATGNPQWTQSIGSGVSAGVGSMFGDAAGAATNTGFGLMNSSNPTFNGMFSEQPSGFSSGVPSDSNTYGQGFGLPSASAPSGVGSGGQTGSLGLQGTNSGTGQAGITLGAQKGIDNVNQGGVGGFGNQMGQPDPVGYNSTNGGMMRFA